MCLVELVDETGDGDDFVATVRHKAFVLHNPYAVDPTPREVWGDLPQLVVEGDAMRWTDGKKILAN